MLTKSLISAPMGNNNSKNSKPQKQNEENFEDFDSQISKFSKQQSTASQDSPRLSTKQGSKVSAKQSAKQSAADTAADSDSDSELMEKLQKHSPAISAAPRSRELVINYNAFPDIDSDIGPSELSDIAEEPEDEYSDSETERRQGSSVAKLDLANMYKNPLLNNNNVWKPASTSTSTTSTPGQKVESSQVTNSQFQQRLQPPQLDNANTANKNLGQESGDTAPAPSTRWGQLELSMRIYDKQAFKCSKQRCNWATCPQRS